ncbi:MAG: tetratricopeptide repeat protein [Spirochaetota bacterium]
MKLFLTIIMNVKLLILITLPVYSQNLIILVYPFQNSGERKYSFYSAGLTDSVISDLGRIRGVEVIPEAERKKTIAEIMLSQTGLIDETKAIKTGRILGANIIFTGSYFISGEKIRVNAKLMDVEKGVIKKSIKIDGTLDKIFELQEKLVFSLMTQNKKEESAANRLSLITDAERKSIENKRRPKIGAYELYSKGISVQDENPKEALGLFRQAILLDDMYVDPLVEAGFTAGNILNNYAEALNYYKKADEILIKYNEIKSIKYACLLNNIGCIYEITGELDGAFNYYIKAKTIRNDLGLQKSAGSAGILSNIGNIYSRKRQFDSAIEYYIQAKVIYDGLSLQRTGNYASLLNNIGVIHMNKGHLDDALGQYIKARAIRDSHGLQKTVGYADLLMNIGIIYKEKGELEHALDYYLKSKKIRDSIGLQLTVNYALLLCNIGKNLWQ